MQASIVLQLWVSLDIYIYILLLHPHRYANQYTAYRKRKREKPTKIARVIDVWWLIIRTKNSNPVNYKLWLKIFVVS